MNLFLLWSDKRNVIALVQVVIEVINNGYVILLLKDGMNLLYHLFWLYRSHTVFIAFIDFITVDRAR